MRKQQDSKRGEQDINRLEENKTLQMKANI